jgi:peroxiredoxin
MTAPPPDTRPGVERAAGPWAARTVRRMSRPALPYLAVLAIALTVVLFSRPWQKPDRSVPGSGVIVPPAGPRVGAPAPDFSLRSLDGSPLRLSDLRGQIVFVAFWATWCGPCQGELSGLQTVYAREKDHGFAVLAVNAEGQSQEQSRRVSAETRDDRGLTFPIVLDTPDGAVFQAYGLTSVPTGVLVDRDGTVREIIYGSVTRDSLTDTIDALRGQGP